MHFDAVNDGKTVESKQCSGRSEDKRKTRGLLTLE